MHSIPTAAPWHCAIARTPCRTWPYHDGWLEAPFWIWSSEDPRRQPLFARQQGSELTISDRGESHVHAFASSRRRCLDAVEQLQDLAASGIKIRTRALTTTLFARLLLGDIFLHGIGGAKYDQVTNQIAEHFFGFSLARIRRRLRNAAAAPPIKPLPSAWSNRSLRQQLRELDYHPERYLSMNGTPASNSSDAAELIAEKQHWISTPTTPTNAHDRHVGITGPTPPSNHSSPECRRDVNRQLNEAVALLQTPPSSRSREYSFALFPRERLRRLMLGEPPSLD